MGELLAGANNDIGYQLVSRRRRLPPVQLGQQPCGRIHQPLSGSMQLTSGRRILRWIRRLGLDGLKVEPAIEGAAGTRSLWLHLLLRALAGAHQLELLRLEVLAGLAGHLQAGGSGAGQGAGVLETRLGRGHHPEEAGPLLYANVVLGLALELREGLLVLNPVLESGA